MPLATGLKPSSSSPPTKSARPKVIDLFSGVGGLSLGATWAGFDVALAVELDKYAFSAHKKNFPSTKHLQGDLAKIGATDLLQSACMEAGQLDGLVCGPPCQGFSTMGKREVNDPRNKLFEKCFALAAELKPKFVVVENVPGILRSTYDQIRRKAFDKIEGEYNLLPPLLLDASEFGAATARKRIFFIATRRTLTRQMTADAIEAKKWTLKTTVQIALAGLPKIRASWQREDQSWRKCAPQRDSDYWRLISQEIPDGVGDQPTLKRYKERREVSGCFGTIHEPEVIERFAGVKNGSADSISKAHRLHPSGFCPTLRAGTAADRGSFQAVRPIHPTSPRVITPREAARLQGFPDWFSFDPTKWHAFRQIGNSVSPFVAKAIFDTIYQKLFLQ